MRVMDKCALNAVDACMCMHLCMYECKCVCVCVCVVSMHNVCVCVVRPGGTGVETVCVTLFSDKITCLQSIARLAVLSNEEWSKVLLERSCLFSESVDLVEGVAEGDVAAKELIVKLERRNNPMCQCVSHNDDESYGFTYALMEISPPLTDDSGNTLAPVLLHYCLKAAGLKNVAYESVRPGSSTSVKYILQLPSGETSLFSGWPDHH